MHQNITKLSKYTTLLMVFMLLLMLPVMSFWLAKPSEKDNLAFVSEKQGVVLGTNTNQVTYIEGKLKLEEIQNKVLEFQIELEPNEYYTKPMDELTANKKIYLSNSDEEVYAEIKDSKLEIINLSDNTKIVEGILY